MEHLEGRQSVLAALRARQRRFQVILLRHDAHAEKVQDVIDLAGQLAVPIRRVAAQELDAVAHGATHGGVLAIASEKPRTTPDQLIKHADTAMYLAKARGRAQYRFFDPAMASNAYAALVMEGELAQALERGEFELYFQPQVSARNDMIVGAEALIRWHHPRRGLLQPSAFIPVAEQQRLMRRLADLGIRVSVDDFGTGYSSLGHLKELPIDKMKIDSSFVKDLPADRGSTAITRAIIQMARSLGITAIAEGVETQAQRSFLALNGCDELQGELISKPLPAEAFEAWVMDYRGRMSERVSKG